MRAIVCRQHGEPQSLELADVPVPRIGDQEWLVAIEGAGLAAGRMRPLVSDVLPLERVPAGLRRYADRKILSKWWRGHP